MSAGGDWADGKRNTGGKDGAGVAVGVGPGAANVLNCWCCCQSGWMRAVVTTRAPDAVPVCGRELEHG